MVNLPDNIIQKAISDEQENLKELEYLYISFLNKMVLEEKKIKNASRFIEIDTFRLVSALISERINDFKAQIKEIHNIKFTKLSDFEKLNEKLFEYLRSSQYIISSLITSTDWQSPSASYSLFPQSGRQTNRISANINDYKRDVHLDEKDWEKLYVKEYIDSRIKLDKVALLVNSGQAAFQVVLDYLVMEKKIKGKIIIGKNVYFQNKQLIVNTFGDRTIEVFENDLKGIVSTLKRYKPDLIYLDSLSVTKNIPVPDLDKLIDFLHKNIKKDTYLIIDNTCLSICCQPMRLSKILGKLHIIVIESLNKFYQFGMDRVTGGVIVTSLKDAGGIYEYRKHSGTNITDFSVYSLPTPNFQLLFNRYKRLERNVKFISMYLNNILTGINNSYLEKIIYPGIGTFFNIVFKEKYQNKSFYNKFIDKVLSEAKKQRVNIINGTSFGFNITRIYLTASYTNFTQPFIRVSAGTENLAKIHRIKTALEKAIFDCD